MINNAVSKALFETQLETLENFKKFLAAKDDVDMEFMEELINGFKDTLQAPKITGPKKGAKGAKKSDSEDGAEKKKRAPSAYTMYIQYQMQLLKKENPEIKSGKDLMAKAVEAWGELTEENKAELKKMLKDDPSLTSEQLVTRVIGGNNVPSAPKKLDDDSEPEPEADAEEKEATPVSSPKAKKATKKAAAKKA